MVCGNCKIKKVCRVYSMIADLDIIISKCEFNSDSSLSNQPFINGSSLSESIEDVEREIIKDENNTPSINKKVIDKAVICESCNENVDKLFTCKNCGAKVCADCIITAVDTDEENTTIQKEKCMKCW